MTLNNLKVRIEEAGLFVTPEENMGTWRRVTVCSRRESGVYSGNSFWVTKVHRRWFIGVWSGYVFEAKNASLIVDLAVWWLARDPHTTRGNFSPEAVQKFGLDQAEDDFDALV